MVQSWRGRGRSPPLTSPAGRSGVEQSRAERPSVRPSLPRPRSRLRPGRLRAAGTRRDTPAPREGSSPALHGWPKKRRQGSEATREAGTEPPARPRHRPAAPAGRGPGRPAPRSPPAACPPAASRLPRERRAAPCGERGHAALCGFPFGHGFPCSYTRG